MPENSRNLMFCHHGTQHCEFLAMAILYVQQIGKELCPENRIYRMIFENECPHRSVSMIEKEWFLKGMEQCLFSSPNWTPSLSDKAMAPNFSSYHLMKQDKHCLTVKASALSLKNYGHSSISNLGHHKPAFSG